MADSSEAGKSSRNTKLTHLKVTLITVKKNQAGWKQSYDQAKTIKDT